MFYLMKSKYAIFSNIKVTKIECSTVWDTWYIFLYSILYQNALKKKGSCNEHVGASRSKRAMDPGTSRLALGMCAKPFVPPLYENPGSALFSLSALSRIMKMI